MEAIQPSAPTFSDFDDKKHSVRRGSVSFVSSDHQDGGGSAVSQQFFGADPARSAMRVLVFVLALPGTTNPPVNKAHHCRADGHDREDFDLFQAYAHSYPLNARHCRGRLVQAVFPLSVLSCCAQTLGDAIKRLNEPA